MHLRSIAACSVPTIYPIGYSSRYAMQRIDDLMKEPMTLLIDTRYKPTSQLSQLPSSLMSSVVDTRIGGVPAPTLRMRERGEGF